MSEGLLTEEEVKTYLELDHPAVEKLVRKGRLTAYRLGGAFVRYRKDEVLAIKNGRKFQLPDQMERGWFDRVRDFWNFYGLYILLFLAALLVVLLLIQR